VIDLSQMRSVHVNSANSTVRVQGGATLGDHWLKRRSGQRRATECPERAALRFVIGSHFRSYGVPSSIPAPGSLCGPLRNCQPPENLNVGTLGFLSQGPNFQ
jgi:hypothetical protein